MKKILITVVGLAIGFSFFSCSDKKKTSNEINENPLTLEIEDSNYNETESKNQLWHPTNKKIIVLFGYNYNDSNFVTKTLSLLNEQFGLNENDGAIYPVVFPDDFRHKDKAVSVDLYNILDDDFIDVAGFISLGAPEKTYRALTKIQDKWNGQIPFPVISIFPQDDILGIEDTSTIVINQIQQAETEESLLTESEQTGIADAELILKNTVSYILRLEGAPEKDGNLANHIRQMLPGKIIHRYTDSETGLFSINHFVIE
ncbi:MAG: hypothetical protein MJ182_01500 [Treponema sp.]|nr:hypothetical protein [Treponema sp.]